jgi:hypothetical protein
MAHDFGASQEVLKDSLDLTESPLGLGGDSMAISYENQRIHFDATLKRYLEYVELYKLLNNGSREGVTPFADFYWRMNYYTRYEDPTDVGSQGY